MTNHMACLMHFWCNGAVIAVSLALLSCGSDEKSVPGGVCKGCHPEAPGDGGAEADSTDGGEPPCDSCSSDATVPPIDLDALGCPICPTDGKPHCGAVVVDSDAPGCMQA